MRAIIYCRVSTKEQTDNLSIPTQRKACREYCARQGLAVAHEFIEAGESAKTADRTQLQALLKYCREHKGKVQTLVVYNLSRFSRDRFDHAVIRTQLQKIGVTLRSVTEPIDDSPAGKLMEGMISAIAQFDNDQKAERTTTGMQEALKLGRWTFKAPLGFVNAGSKVGPSLLPDPDRADLIRRGFQDVADGRSVADVLRQLNAAGLRGAQGRPLCLQSFRMLLRNPVFIGRIEIPKWGISRAGDFDPLVTEPVFRRVQLRLEGKAEPIRHVRDRDDFPLRRFLTCAHCRKPITGSWSTGRNGRYGYYHCPKCAGVRRRREDVEGAFLRHLQGLCPDPEYLRLFNAIVLDVWRAEQARAREVQQLRTKRVQDITARLDRLEEAFIFQRSIDQRVYERQRDKLQEELAIAELALHDARIDQLDVEGVLAFAEHLLTNIGTAWFEASLQQRQQIQAAIFPEGLPFDGRGFGTAPTCLAFSCLRESATVENGMASPPGTADICTMARPRNH